MSDKINPSSNQTKILSLMILFVFLFIILVILQNVFNLPWATTILVGLFGMGIFQVLLERMQKFIHKWVEPTVLLILSQSLFFFRIHKYKHFWRVYIVFVTFLLVLVLFYHNTISFASHVANDMLCIRSDVLSNNVIEYFSQGKNEVYKNVCGNGLDDVLSFAMMQDEVKLGLVALNEVVLNQSNAIFEKNDSGDEKMLESMIAQQNKDHDACTRKEHITLAVVTTFSNTSTDKNISASMGIENLRGAAIAQKAYNDNPSHNTKVCLILANLGTRKVEGEQIKTVINKLIRYAKYDLTFRGIVGFPYSKHAVQVVSDRDWQQNASRLPIVSSAAMSNELDLLDTYKYFPESKQYFHRVVKSNEYQAHHIIDFISHKFKTLEVNKPATKIAILIGQDSYTQDLGNKLNEVISNGSYNIQLLHPSHGEYSYREEDDNSLQQATQNAVNDGAQILLFSGYAFDLETLENKLDDIKRSTGKSIPVVSGQGVFGLYSGTSLYKYIKPVAPVYSAIYAGPIDNADPFYQLYKEKFPSVVSNTYSNYSLLPTHTILAQEATYVFLDAVAKANSSGIPSRDDLNSLISTLIVDGPKYQNKSDKIKFQKGASSPIDKSDYIVCIGTNGYAHLSAVYVPTLATQYDVDSCN